MEGLLYEDIFRIDKYLINGVDLYLKLFRNFVVFVLMSKEVFFSYKLQLLDVFFKVCMIKVDSGILINYVEILKEKMVKYFLIRIEVKMSICFKGFGLFIWQNVWFNILLIKVVFCFIF